MTTSTVRLHRWDEIALEKVTEMISRKIVTGDREMLAQVYLKKGALVPMHSHESEQMTYVLQGALKFLINGEEITVREGEVLHIPSWIEHQAEALDDTFELDLFSPIRQDWLDHTDTYFHVPERRVTAGTRGCTITAGARMRITSASGDEFQLVIVRYQFPDVDEDRWESNWLIVNGTVAAAGEKWVFTEPCVTTFELADLADWLDELAANGSRVVGVRVHRAESEVRVCAVAAPRRPADARARECAGVEVGARAPRGGDRGVSLSASRLKRSPRRSGRP